MEKDKRRMFVSPPITFLRVPGGLSPTRLFDTIEYKYKFAKNNPDYFKPSGTLIFCGSQGEGKTLSAVSYILRTLERFPCAVLCTNTEIMGYPPNAYINKVTKKDIEWLAEYKKIESERRHEWYEERKEKLKEHHKYSKSDMSEADYVSMYIQFYPFNRKNDFDEWKAEAEWELRSLSDDSLITPETIQQGIHQHVCVQYWGLDTLKYINNGKFGVIYFIDEIHLELNSLESRNIDVEIMVEISQQRKQRKHIVGTSQRYARMAKPLREQIRDIVVCKNFFGMIQYNRLIDGDSCTEKSDGTLNYKIRKRFLWFHSPAMYLLYDTYVKMRRYKNEWQGRERDPFMNLEVNVHGSTE